jgi:hypothetical protein
MTRFQFGELYPRLGLPRALPTGLAAWHAQVRETRPVRDIEVDDPERAG